MEGIWAKHEQFHYQPGEEFLIQNLRASEIDKENLMTHWHEELEIVYVIDCENTHYIDGVRVEAKPGNLIVTNSEILHTIVEGAIKPEKTLIAVLLILSVPFLKHYFPEYKTIYFTNEKEVCRKEIREIMLRLSAFQEEPSLTSDAQERTILVTIRMICALIGSTIVTTFTMPLVNSLGKGSAKQGYLLTMTVYAIIAIALFFVTFKNTEEKVKIAVNGDNRGLNGIIEDVKGLNGQSMILLALGFLYFTVFTIRSSSIMYYFIYNLERVDLVPLIGVLGTFSGLPALLLLPYITEKIGKRNATILGAVIYIAGTLLIFISGQAVAGLGTGLAVTGCGMYLMQSSNFAISPDAIDYCEYKSGRSIAGLLTALQGFSVKLAMGISGFVLGQMLKYGGYVENQKQSAKALSMIQIGFIWIPVVFCVLIIVLMMFYTLDKQLPQMRAELAKRREK